VSRAGRIGLLLAALAAFVLLSLVIARVLTVGNAERDAVYAF